MFPNSCKIILVFFSFFIAITGKVCTVVTRTEQDFSLWLRTLFDIEMKFKGSVSQAEILIMHQNVIAVVTLYILKSGFPAHLKYVYPQGRLNLPLPHPSQLQRCLRFLTISGLTAREGWGPSEWAVGTGHESLWARPTLTYCHGTPEYTKGAQKDFMDGRIT